MKTITKWGLSALTVTALMTGCAADPESSETGSQTASSGDASGTATGDSGEPEADQTVIIDGSLTKPYGLPSVDEFARSSIISDVVTGTVVSTQTQVLDPGAEVFTEITIKVDTARNAAPGSLITVRETGGIVRLGQVKSILDGRMSAEEIRAKKDSTVDFRIADQPHTQKGDSVLFFLGGQSTDPGGQYVAARMADDGKGQFKWMGKPFNDQWVPAVDRASAKAKFNLKG